MPLLGPLPAVGEQAFVGGLDALPAAVRRQVLAGKTHVLLTPSAAEAVLLRPLRLPTGEMGGVVRVVAKSSSTAAFAAAKSAPDAELPPLPAAVRAVISREQARLIELPAGNAERAVCQDLIRWTSALPWHEPPLPTATLASAAAHLEKNHHGMAAVKQRLLEHLAVRLHSGKSRGEVLLLAGPPGIGKTTLARQIAAALGRPFAALALGGLRDEAEIRGHRRTYVGARPGKIIEALAQCQSLAPVILLDELDKLEVSPGGGAVANALLEVLDSAQNQHFLDHYLGYGVDLSRVLFLATANDESLVPAALRDRMELVSLGGYSEADKVAIATKHLIPRLRRELSLSPAQFVLGKETLRELIRGYTDEAGVRELARLLASLGRKTVVATLERRTAAAALTVDQMRAYLGEEPYMTWEAPRSVAPGAVQMLAICPRGGGVLSLEALQGHGVSGGGATGGPALTITGNFGRVAQESAQVALAHFLSLAAKLHLGKAGLSAAQLHLHAPLGSLEKDGASAGLAMFCAFASLAAQVALPKSLAMTGELTLHGQVLPVGGLREKLLAAQRQGVTQALIPEANSRELASLPRGLTRSLEVRLVRTGLDALQLLGLLAPSPGASAPIGLTSTQVAQVVYQ